MLQTNLEHIESEEQLKKLVENNEKVAVCCGRMGPMCIPVYDIFEILQEDYPDIQFRDSFGGCRTLFITVTAR